MDEDTNRSFNAPNLHHDEHIPQPPIIFADERALKLQKSDQPLSTEKNKILHFQMTTRAAGKLQLLFKHQPNCINAVLVDGQCLQTNGSV